MCGIAGLITTVQAFEHRSALRAMVRRQAHRGPDDEGFESVEVHPFEVGFGQRRLSIVDLSPAGHQPMVDHATGNVLIFNGEIYNAAPLRARLVSLGHRFRGHSDTEVLLYGMGRWGVDFIQDLCGMFAFAFLRRSDRAVILARDPMGIKPLYVAKGPGWFAFASEVRAILASGLMRHDIDRAGLATLLAYGAVHEPLTFFKDIAAFPAGSWQKLTLEPSGQIAPGPINKHWNFPPIDHGLTREKAIPAIRRTLDTAVHEHLISDVPIGVFLSSGVDSTILAGLASRHSERLRTFTVGFSDQQDLSESGLAGQTAKDLRVEHTDIQITADLALAETEQWFNSLDQPSFDGLNTNIISKAVRTRGIVVALSGLGGDELFGGYSTFQDTPRLYRALRMLRLLPGPARGLVLRALAKLTHTAGGEKIMDMGRGEPSPGRVMLLRRRAISDHRMHLLGLDARELGLDETFMPAEALRAAGLNDADDAEDMIAAVSRYESVFQMRNILLRDSDTNGMAHSLEIRVPLLDRRVLDLAYSIPGPVRLPDGVANKPLLRAAFPDLIRPALMTQGKRGFVLPIRRWMAGPLRETCEQALQAVKAHAILNNWKIDKIWSTFLQDPESPMWSRAFVLCVLGVYLRNMRTAAAAKPVPERPAVVA